MLQNIHEHIKGWIAGVVLGAVSLSFVLWGVQYYLQSGGGGSKTVAKVNGDKISESDLNVAFQHLERTYTQRTGHSLNPTQNEELKQYALQNLIMNNVLLNATQKAGFRVSPEQVDQLITSIPAFQENGQFSSERLQEFLYGNSLTSAQFMAQMADALVVQQVEDGISNSAFILPNEIKNNYALINQTRDFRYIIIPSAHFLSDVKVTPKMMASYYQNHQQSFKAPEKVSISYLLLSPEKIRQQVSVSEQEIKNYYENNQKAKPFNKVKAKIKQTLLQQKINTILTKKSDQLSTITYTNPTTLEPAARQLNLKIQTTPLFSRESDKVGIASHAKIVAAAFSKDVLQDGNNSDLIELKDGSLVVLRVKKHESSHILPLKAVSSQIKQQIEKQLTQAKAALLAGKIQNILNENKSLAEIIKTNHLTWRIEKEVTRKNKSIPPAVLESAFSISLKKGHSVTTAVLKNGDSAVIQLTTIKPADFNQASEKQRNALKKTLSTDWGDIDYQFYMKDAKNRSKIVISGK